MNPAPALKGTAAAAAVLGLVVAPPILRAADPVQLERCAAIGDDRLRLACYDAAVQGPAVTPPPPQLSAQPAQPAATPPASQLDRLWAIGTRGSDSRFDLRPHKASYFLAARYSTAPNVRPSSPAWEPPPADLDVQSVEAKFQLSFKVKMADIGGHGSAALWAGYTQQSHWQMYNADASRPFRESDYEPELMLALHPDLEALGWRWRLLVVGLNHQSNGGSDPLSRSWNRAYAQFGIERGDFALLLRPWWRIPESSGDDDNPDITRYLGHGDVVGIYRLGGHSLSALARYNLDSGYGALQLGWHFPLARRVRGYLQFFSGYGESLIDYNVRQTTIGIGVSLADHL